MWCFTGRPSNITSYVVLDRTLLSYPWGGLQSLSTLAVHRECTPPVQLKWTQELGQLGFEPDWEVIWSNRNLTSQNVAHQIIHFEVIHRAYATPYVRYKMKLQSHYNCQFCTVPTSGTFLHMFWECPEVAGLWTRAVSDMAHLLSTTIIPDPCLCLLNDDTHLQLSLVQKRILFASFTAVKKTIINHWFEPEVPMHMFWLNSFRRIVNLEHSVARLHKARPQTLAAWETIAASLRNLR